MCARCTISMSLYICIVYIYMYTYTEYIKSVVGICIHHAHTLTHHAIVAWIPSWPFWSWHLGFSAWFHPEVVWRLLGSVGCILIESKNSWMKSKKSLPLSSAILPSTNLVAQMKHENWSHRSSVCLLDSVVHMAIHANQECLCDAGLWPAINLHGRIIVLAGPMCFFFFFRL